MKYTRGVTYSYPAFHRLRRPLRPLRGGVLRSLVSNLQSQNAARNSASSTCGPAPSCVVQGGHRGVLVQLTIVVYLYIKISPERQDVRKYGGLFEGVVGKASSVHPDVHPDVQPIHSTYPVNGELDIPEM